ncbi:proteasome subunit beta [Candidatus Woesearchaeota archaeon]|nr:proteasome subunit beta [Candidatus Woesearchaeota archaeon]
MSEKKYKKTGTTTLVMVCKDGILMAADKRATAGNFIANKKETKVFPVSDNIAITTAGLVSDAQLLTKYIKAEIKLKEIKTQRKILVKEAMNILAGLNYSNIRQFSSVPGIVGFLIAGFDDTNGLSAYEIGIDGSISHVDEFASDGSGSVFVYGLLEEQYHTNLTIKDAIPLAIKALEVAQKRDSASGNGFDIIKITDKGVEKVASKHIDVKLEL